MAGCVLRASGDDFQPEAFLAGSTFDPCNVFRKDEHKTLSCRWDTSGLTVVVSEANDFAQQVTDALEFLKSNRAEMWRLKGSAGLAEMSLDFGVSRKDDFLQSHLFTSELISLAGELQMGLAVSIYGTN